MMPGCEARSSKVIFQFLKDKRLKNHISAKFKSFYDNGELCHFISFSYACLEINGWINQTQQYEASNSFKILGFC